VNARHADETMNGNYQYASIMFCLCKLEQVSGKLLQRFIDGEVDETASSTKPFPRGLPEGDYIIVYKAEFTEEHPMRKLSICICAEQEVHMERIRSNNYPADFIDSLRDACNLSYVRQSEDIDIPI
jgi:DNA-dependent RNA polymerase auxiliary subunit epsilon